MGTFEFFGASGAHVSCMAFGQHSNSDCLQQSNNVHIYFDMANPGKHDSPGMVWIHDNAYVVLIAECVAVLTLAQVVTWFA